MTYKLFLDDLRTVKMVYPDQEESDFKIVRTCDAFIKCIQEKGFPEFISFDNDLGEDENNKILPDGYAAAKWLVYESGLDLKNIKYRVHSANPVARVQIESLLDNYIHFLKNEKNNKMSKRNYFKDVLFGIAVGDALGVPVEFVSREVIRKTPVTSMRGYGTHEQPSGTWSDDSSLAFCLSESLCTGYNLQDLANRFVNWKEHAYWTPHGKVFDIGIATSQAIWNLKNGTSPVLAGGIGEESNGNGSLMRILPLVFYLRDKNIEERFTIVKEVSSLTHRHIRSVISCFIYLEFALEIMKGIDIFESFIKVTKSIDEFFDKSPICSEEERFKFYRILARPDNVYNPKSIYEYSEGEISSSGYVVHTLEASLWCLLTTDNYKDAVLKAVNLGSDTDTTGTVTGGLAGLYYGYESIPEEWIEALARKKDIEELALKLQLELI